MIAEKTISICNSIDDLSESMHGKRTVLKELIKTLPPTSGLKILLLAQLDQIHMAQREIDQSTTFIVQQLRRHQNSTAA